MAKQRTIRTQATIRGIGIQTGGVVKLKLDPAPPDSGIVFVRTDLAGAPTVKVHPSSVNQSNKVLQRTVLRSGKAEVHTVEHLLAALSGFYVDNLFISIDNAELPGLDGSAKEYARVIKEAGIIEQDAPKHHRPPEKRQDAEHAGYAVQGCFRPCPSEQHSQEIRHRQDESNQEGQGEQEQECPSGLGRLVGGDDVLVASLDLRQPEAHAQQQDAGVTRHPPVPAPPVGIGRRLGATGGLILHVHRLHPTDAA